MMLKYVVKKTTFGFEKDKAEKYVVRPFKVVNVDFKMLCDHNKKGTHPSWNRKSHPRRIDRFPNNLYGNWSIRQFARVRNH